MEIVKIPENANPWRCVVNGVLYEYAAGETATVPDGVAAVVRAYYAGREKQREEEPWEKVAKDAESEILFALGMDANGLYTATKEDGKKKVTYVSDTKIESFSQALSQMQRAIRFQAKLAQGQVWDFEEDSQEAYVRSVPTGAHAAAVMEIGGKTVVQDGALVSGAVSSVLAEGPGQEPFSCPIPAAVQALPGYGWSSGGVCNSIQRRGDKWVYVQRTAKFVYDGNTPKLGCDSNYQQATQKFNYIYSLDIHDLAPNSRCISTIGEPVGLTTGFNIGGAYCTTTISVFIPNQAAGGTRDEYIAACRSYLRDHPVTVHYELETPIETDITDLMGDALSPIAVEPGGSLTMKNAGELAVPATVKYITKLSEVSANG